MTAQPVLSPSTAPHIHVGGETCPYCQQDIPNERVAEILDGKGVLPLALG